MLKNQIMNGLNELEGRSIVAYFVGAVNNIVDMSSLYFGIEKVYDKEYIIIADEESDEEIKVDLSLVEHITEGWDELILHMQGNINIQINAA